MSIEVSTGEEPYLIVSSDTHAGLQCEDYRAYLDSSLHEEFDNMLKNGTSIDASLKRLMLSS